MKEEFSRLELLVGDERLSRLRGSTVLLCGVGGVGSWAAEAVIRGGIGHLVMLDPDTVKLSNINRQLCALHSTIGRLKVDVMAERLKDINPEAEIEAMPVRLQPDDCVPLLEKNHFDCVIDAIDERPPKLALIVACKQMGIPVISSMGAANKRDSSCVEVADISESHGCPLARIVRKNLRKMGVESGVRVVYSPELPSEESIAEISEEKGEKRPIGSISYMPAIFGLKCAEEALAQVTGR